MPTGQYDETLDLSTAKVTATNTTKVDLVAAVATGRIQPRTIVLSNNDTVAHRFDLCEGTTVKLSMWVPTKDSKVFNSAGWKLAKGVALKFATDAAATTTEPDASIEYDLATG